MGFPHLPGSSPFPASPQADLTSRSSGVHVAASTAGPASHSCRLRLHSTAALPVLHNRSPEPGSGATGTVSDLPQ